jgi:hypothetical protein
MTDLLAGYGAPGRFARPVTPSDTDDFPDGAARGLGFNEAGTVKLVAPGDSDDQAVTFDAYAGEILPCWTRKVFATGTTVTNILAVY